MGEEGASIGSVKADLINRGDDGSIEELLTSRDLPFPILGREICGGKVTKHAGHGNGTVSPWLTKGKIEFVIFDVLIPGNMALARIII